MRDLETKITIKGITNEPTIILNSMQQGAKEFERRVGRPMIYSEMRAMWE